MRRHRHCPLARALLGCSFGEAGHRGRAAALLGEPITAANDIEMYSSPANDAVLSETRLRKVVRDAADSLG